MAFDEKLGDRIRELLARTTDNIVEKKMFGGLCFMVNGKMCVGIMKDELLCRIDPATVATALIKGDCHEMAFKDKVMKGFVLVPAAHLQHKKELSYWVNLCLEFNPYAKVAKKKN